MTKTKVGKRHVFIPVDIPVSWNDFNDNEMEINQQVFCEIYVDY